MRTTKGRSRAAREACVPVHLARLLTHVYQLFCAAELRVSSARGAQAREAADLVMLRATKLQHLLPSLLYSSDGRLQRRQRAALLTAGDLGRLIQWQLQYERVGASAVRSDDPPSNDVLHAAAADATAYSGGVREGAQLLTSDVRTPRTAATYDTLLAKHPADDGPAIQAAVADGRARLAARGEQLDLSFCTPDLIYSVLMAADPLSAAGPSGLRYVHLQDAVRATGGKASSLVAALARVQHTLLSSPRTLPPAFWALHSSATLSALGDKARPIACGDVLRRLISSATLRALGDRLGLDLRDSGQFGVSVPSGVEHTAAGMKVAHEGGQWKSTLDGRNAFNELMRAPMLRTAATMLPEAFEYVCHLYAGAPPHLLFQLAAGGIAVVPSRRGVQQGDPLGPALYCCGIHRVLRRFNASLRQRGGRGAACAYMDDIFGWTSRLDATWLGAVRQVAGDLLEVGITVRPDKSFVLPPPGHMPTVAELAQIRAAGLTPAADDGLMCVGVPVGSNLFEQHATAASITRLNSDKLARHLAAMKDYTQSAMLLATQSLCRRMGYLMRNVDPALAAPAFAQYDSLCLWAMEHVMSLAGAAPADVFFGNADVDSAPPPLAAAHLALAPHQRAQVHMSLQSGGLHLASAMHASDAAFIGGHLITLPAMLADMSGGVSTPWLDGELAANVPATPLVRALGAAIQRTAARGVPRDRLGLIIPPSWVTWALGGGDAPPLEVLGAHDCPRVQLPSQTDDDPAARRHPRRRDRAPGATAQTALTHELNKLRFASLRRSFGTLSHAPAFPGAETLPQAMARHRSQTGKGAMSWVTARPASPALTISPPACKLALRRALGIEAHHGARCPFASSCQTQAPADERHARHCRAMGYSYIHDRVRDDLAAILTSYGVVHRREDPTPFANGRVDLSTLAGALPLSGNRRLLQRGALLDVTVVDPLVHIRHRASTTDGAAAAFAHTRKLQKYRGASLRFDHATYTLWPLALESYGRWGDTAEEFIDALATHAIGGADSASWRAKGAIVHGIRQRLAVTLQRATSAHVMRYAQRRLELERASGGTVPVADHLVA